MSKDKAVWYGPAAPEGEQAVTADQAAEMTSAYVAQVIGFQPFYRTAEEVAQVIEGHGDYRLMRVTFEYVEEGEAA